MSFFVEREELQTTQPDESQLQEGDQEGDVANSNEETAKENNDKAQEDQEKQIPGLNHFKNFLEASFDNGFFHKHRQEIVTNVMNYRQSELAVLTEDQKDQKTEITEQRDAFLTAINETMIAAGENNLHKMVNDYLQNAASNPNIL